MSFFSSSSSFPSLGVSLMEAVSSSSFAWSQHASLFTDLEQGPGTDSTKGNASLHVKHSIESGSDLARLRRRIMDGLLTGKEPLGLRETRQWISRVLAFSARKAKKVSSKIRFLLILISFFFFFLFFFSIPFYDFEYQIRREREKNHKEFIWIQISHMVFFFFFFF